MGAARKIKGVLGTLPRGRGVNESYARIYESVSFYLDLVPLDYVREDKKAQIFCSFVTRVPRPHANARKPNFYCECGIKSVPK